MVSVASGGTADQIAARILFKVLRAGSATPARYSSTFFGAPLPFAAELRLPDFTFFMPAMLQELPLQGHAPDQRAPVGHEKCHSFFCHTFTCPCSWISGHLPKRSDRRSTCPVSALIGSWDDFSFPAENSVAEMYAGPEVCSSIHARHRKSV